MVSMLYSIHDWCRIPSVSQHDTMSPLATVCHTRGMSPLSTSVNEEVPIALVVSCSATLCTHGYWSKQESLCDPHDVMCRSLCHVCRKTDTGRRY